jgi:hypothetical protein
VHVLEHDPAAVELIDEVLIELASNTTEFADVAGKLPDQTEAALLVEFYAEDDEDGARKFEGSSKTVCPVAATSATALRIPTPNTSRLTRWRPTTTRIERSSGSSGSPASHSLGRTSYAKHISFTEDCAVPPEHLPRLVTEF